MLHHNIDGGFVPSPAREELNRLTSMSPKAKKEPANVARMQALEWQLGFYKKTVKGKDYPTLPPRVIRATIHTAAKLTRDGQRVNRGLQVLPAVDFEYGEHSGKAIEELAGIPEFRFDAVVAVQRQRVLRVRPLFPQWQARFRVRVLSDQVNEADLRVWLRSAGSMIGFGDWRPDKGGEFGMFELVSLDEVPND